MGDKGDTEVTLKPTTRVNAGVAIAAVISACGFTALHFNILHEIKTEASKTKAEVSLTRDAVLRMESQMWTRQHQEIFALRLKNMNPNLTVPETRDIGGR